MITLENADIIVSVDPERGGGITRFAWRGIDIFRPAVAGDVSPLGLSSFVLVPFSNRIEDGRFEWQGHRFVVPPNRPGEAHPLHGLGWLSSWSEQLTAPDRLVLEHAHSGDTWPFAYRAEQTIELFADGFRHRLGISNTGTVAMPAGLGFHPYFPRAGARLVADFDGMWQTRPDGIPTIWRPLAAMPAWFGGETIDTVFTGRRGALAIDWPGHGVTIEPSQGLEFTTIYCPAGADYFCVEPVSHMTDALNRPATASSGQRSVEPGETWAVSVDYRVHAAGRP